jgi:hypothetical protein
MRDTSAGRHDRYEIRIQGHLAARWAARFDGMTLTTHDNGTTVLEGPVVDQAALHGLLATLRDIGLPLVSVTQLGSDAQAAPQTRPHGTHAAPATTPQGD